MPGMLGFLGNNASSADKPLLLETIDLLSLNKTRIVDLDEGFVAVSSLSNSPLKGERFYNQQDTISCFSGDLIGTQCVPWDNILNIIKTKKYSKFREFHGNFAIAHFNKKEKRITIISDRRSQHPIYYFITGNTLIYSTAISTYCRLADIPEFNVNWLHELLFFNYPIGQTTIFKDVLRMPPASILEYNLKSSKFSLFEYADHFRKPNSLIKGKKALKKALYVFNERMPKYFEKNTKVAVSLTAGFDSRTVLSFAPCETKETLETYTYGVADCIDLVEASRVSSMLRLPHRKITFDKRFLDNLPKLIYETVYLSSGLQGINRSTLLYMYRSLTNNGQEFPVIITGVSGDHLFRDHINGSGNVPSLISSDMMQVFKKGQTFISTSFFRKAYGDNINNFEHHINNVIEELKAKYGQLNSPESYLSYLVYEITPKHFAGEAAIANNYSTFRTPYWDEDIIQLSYEIEYGTLGFSESLRKKDTYREKILQAFLVQNNKYFSEASIYGLPLNLFANNNKLLYNANRAIKRGPKKIKSFLRPRPIPPLEDWSNWYNTILDREINNLISKNSLISNYLSPEFLKEIKQEKNTHWLGKIITAEIVLTLIKNRWNI